MALGLGAILFAVFPAKAISLQPTQQLEFLEPDPIAAEILYQDWKSRQYCSCVLYARQFRDFPSIGLAKNLPIRSITPFVGAITITNESYAGHLGIVVAVGQETITIVEANYIPCQKSERILNINDPRIRGYY